MDYLFILLDHWQLCPLGDIWQYLEIFSILVVIIGEMLLEPKQGCKTSYNAQGCLTWQRIIICYKVSIMLRLGNLNLDHYSSFIRDLKFFMKYLLILSNIVPR